ncbi:MAG: hypothetical protein U0271_02245 [Polyangiaceae bacterium]
MSSFILRFAIIVVACAASACMSKQLVATDPTTVAEGGSGWLLVEARSMDLSFTVPATQSSDIGEYSDYRAFKRCSSVSPTEEKEGQGVQGGGSQARYSRFVCVRDGDRVYTVMVFALSDDDLNMFEHIFGKLGSRADQHQQLQVNGYDGYRASKLGKDGHMSAWQVWEAGDRFYIAQLEAASLSAFSSSDAQRFLDSLTMLDRL